MSSIVTVSEAGATGVRKLRSPQNFPAPSVPLRSRTAYAAAHVIPRVTGDNTPGAPADIDWDATLGFRRHLWSWGLGVADAMDTAQRNMGLDPTATRELVARSAAEATEVGGRLVVGVSTDHVEEEVISLPRVVDAYVEQLHHAEDHGTGAVLMASRHLVRAAEGAADYERVYREVLARAGAPVILHWLGPAFDPQLTGYFGSTDVLVAMNTLGRIILENHAQVRGIKMSLLDAGHERRLRAQLPAGVQMFTGDDYNFVDLIAGDGERYSDALLGAFAAIAPQASMAIRALDAGRTEEYHRILQPAEQLARHVFCAPTYHYKAGIAFLSWLNGHQPAYSMVGGLHSARSLPHLSQLVELADVAGALEDPDLAARRWNSYVETFGINVKGVSGA